MSLRENGEKSLREEFLELRSKSKNGALLRAVLVLMSWGEHNLYALPRLP